MNDVNTSTESSDLRPVAVAQPLEHGFECPRADAFDGYAQAQLLAAGDEPPARARVFARVVIALIRTYRREVNMRLDRLLSQLGEVERGATDAYTTPPIASAFVDLFRASNARCENAPDTVGLPNWRACPCAVCGAWRAFNDRFDTDLTIEDVLENAVAVAVPGYVADRTIEEHLELVYQTIDGDFTEHTFAFSERVYAGALAELTGKAG